MSDLPVQVLVVARGKRGDGRRVEGGREQSQPCDGEEVKKFADGHYCV